MGQQQSDRVSILGGKFVSRPNEVPRYLLNQIELADRWRISPRTLERWRWLNQGPAYLKIGGRVVYRRDDIEAYEAQQRCDINGRLSFA
jgi:hypothetical protein